MKRHPALVIVLAGALAACGDDSPSRALVAETRPITAEEAASLSSDDGHDPLPCPGYGSTEWDWGPISSDAVTGGQPSDALADAIADLGSGPSPDVLPAEGWVELVVDDDDRIFVLEDDQDGFSAAVKVAGDPARGIWRHNEAVLCPNLAP